MATVVQIPYNAAVRAVLASLERNLLPDAVVRRLIRALLAARLRRGYLPSAHLQLSQLLHFKNALEEMPIAVEIDKAKSQHYELPTVFFKLVLGKNLKYSCCYFEDSASTLEDAEVAMFDLYCERAQIEDGQSILDLGCGWGSLSLYLAKKYKNCKITGICNSKTQKAYIDEQCREHQLSNVEIIIADISKHEMDASFDRIISIEMFEHMKNYKALLNKISKWMRPESLLFVHHFCHKTFAYHFEDINDDDWITRYFFSGGTMPSSNLLLYFQFGVFIIILKLGLSCSEEWLRRMDKEADAIRPIMEATYGKDSARKWSAYWRTFFISVAELFAYNNGDEWMVANFLFKKK
ncbi:(S)-coclaurine N-methyltransferase-like [Phalaenopsis equestris]|uniref:(S)-coclaurine N-methyltransferase-like n=1 Tax=Phalaenopsis equestris TaxID=78828 RepID=UPI0009E25624|nr:(S)-coclaurine N-methyltransferase-like [Phalaenopsis equestris]